MPAAEAEATAIPTAISSPLMAVTAPFAIALALAVAVTVPALVMVCATVVAPKFRCPIATVARARAVAADAPTALALAASDTTPLFTMSSLAEPAKAPCPIGEMHSRCKRSAICPPVAVAFALSAIVPRCPWTATRNWRPPLG